MMKLAAEVIQLLQGKTLSTAESCTAGMIGSALGSVGGASAVFKGGVICYCNEVKHQMLDVPEQMLSDFGAVSEPVAAAMAQGARNRLHTDIAVSVTGLAGPGGDEFGNPVGLVYIGYNDQKQTIVKCCHFSGDRQQVRQQAAETALAMILQYCV